MSRRPWLPSWSLVCACALLACATPRAGGPPPECTVDADCRLARVFSCGEILSCQASCPGAGNLVAIGAHVVPEAPSCGPQRPCTPTCPSLAVLPLPPGQVRPPLPVAACVRGRCVVR